MELWERYESIIDDPDAFQRACQRPLPAVVRVNPVKAEPSQVVRALLEEDICADGRDWNAHVLEIDTDAVGYTWPYQHGWIHGQEEISQLPATVLSPNAGDCVWDVAAAPGGKATQLAAMVRGKGGFVVANDVNLGRLSALRSNADRLGIDNLLVTRSDARSFSMKPFEFDQFDGALVDAPCSGEGTTRKRPDVIPRTDPAASASLSGIQADILRRAIQVTAPGGVVVYSTCTFAPEENEGVLDEMLETESVTVEPYSVSIPHAPGIQSWGSATYDQSVRHAKRFYPHLSNTGGFFCAQLRVAA